MFVTWGITITSFILFTWQNGLKMFCSCFFIRNQPNKNQRMFHYFSHFCFTRKQTAYMGFKRNINRHIYARTLFFISLYMYIIVFSEVGLGCFEDLRPLTIFQSYHDLEPLKFKLRDRGSNLDPLLHNRRALPLDHRRSRLFEREIGSDGNFLYKMPVNGVSVKLTFYFMILLISYVLLLFNQCIYQNEGFAICEKCLVLNKSPKTLIYIFVCFSPQYLQNKQIHVVQIIIMNKFDC